ncbi:hypothetical protein Hanom_Chr17g01582851 [Helianthus anomalus]
MQVKPQVFSKKLLFTISYARFESHHTKRVVEKSPYQQKGFIYPASKGPFFSQQA